MTGTTVDQLAEALRITGQLVDAVTDEQWTGPTPCSDWTVRDLVNHLVGGNRRFAAVLAGGPVPAMPELRPSAPADPLGAAPAAAFQASAAELLAAFQRPGALDETFPLPIGRLPGRAALQLRVVEALVHGWDLAHAIGQPARFPAELVEPALAFSRERLGDLPAGRTPFQPPQSVPDDAPAIDRLAALLGRRSPSPGTAA